MNCSNCENPPKDGDYISVVQGSKLIGVLCTPCQETVLVAKLVFSRATPDQDWVFKQYLPVVCAKT